MRAGIENPDISRNRPFFGFNGSTALDDTLMLKHHPIPKNKPLLGARLQLLIFIVILAGLLISYNLASKGMGGGPIGAFPGMGEYLQFDSTQKEGVKATLSGFWAYDGPGTVSLPMRERIRLELKKNGIIWEVREYMLRLPSGDTTRFTHVMHSYILPYGIRRKHQTEIVCESRVLRQVLFMPDDTCYGQSQVDGVRSFKRGGANLTTESLCLVPYGDRPLRDFFPAGAIDFIDSIRLDACPRAMDFAVFAQKAVADDLKRMTVDTRRREDVRAIVDRYYGPIFRMAFPRENTAGKRQSANLSLSIDAGGEVVQARLSGFHLIIAQWETRLISSAKSWQFPKSNAAATVRCPVEW